MSAPLLTVPVEAPYKKELVYGIPEFEFLFSTPNLYISRFKPSLPSYLNKNFYLVESNIFHFSDVPLLHITLNEEEFEAFVGMSPSYKHMAIWDENKVGSKLFLDHKHYIQILKCVRVESIKTLLDGTTKLQSRENAYLLYQQALHNPWPDLCAWTEGNHGSLVFCDEDLGALLLGWLWVKAKENS